MEEDGCPWDPMHKMHVWLENAKTETPSIWRYSNDVEIPDISLHLDKFTSHGTSKDSNVYIVEGHATLDWKSLVTALFSEETFVRRKLAEAGTPMTFPASIKELLDTTATSVARDCPSLVPTKSVDESDTANFEKLRGEFVEAVLTAQGCYHDRLYEEAYDARLRGAYASSGLKTPPNTTDASYTDVAKYYAYVATHVRLLQQFRKDNLRKSVEKCWSVKFGTLKFPEPPVSDDNGEGGSANVSGDGEGEQITQTANQ